MKCMVSTELGKGFAGSVHLRICNQKEVRKRREIRDAWQNKLLRRRKHRDTR